MKANRALASESTPIVLATNMRELSILISIEVGTNGTAEASSFNGNYESSSSFLTENFREEHRNLKAAEATHKSPKLGTYTN